MNQPSIISPNGAKLSSKVPKVKAVHPAASKILVECLKQDEMLDTNLIISESTEFDGAPQAYIVELGPNVQPHSGLEVGQRIYWTGNGTPVEDPRSQKGRVRALMEIHNVIAIIEEEGGCCGGKCDSEQ